MKNPFHEIEKFVHKESTDPEEAVRALMSTIYLHCCENCSAHLRTDEFVEAFEHMLKELKLCRKLTGRNAA